jgi:hypothetical protein
MTGHVGRTSWALPAIAALALVAPSPAPAQNAVTVLSASGYGNFNAAGVLVTVSGDADGDATVALEWRRAGGSFLPAQPLERIDASHFAGSLFGLEPGTRYEARVTLVDPDGVAGSPATAAFETRADTLAEPTLRTLYVSTSGDDGNPGTSPGSPVRTIQQAADLAQAGDLVLIQPGVYRESVSVPRSGTAAQPIVFRGNGAGAILDGADATIAAGAPWTPAAGGTWSLPAGFATGHVVTEAGRLYRYTSLSALQALAAGAPGGFYFDGATLFLKLADASSPSSHTVHVARLENGFVVDGRSYVRIENLEIRHYGSGDYGKGVYLRYSSDCAVRSCRIHEVGSAGIWVKGGERHLLESNEIWDTSIFAWPWGQTKGSSSENNAIAFSDDVGRGHVVRRNTVHGTFNGIAPCGSAAPPSGVTNETDVYENVLSQHTDDGFEPEGYCANLRLWGNRLQDVHMAFAVAPAAPGPLFLVRNVAWRVGNTRTSLLDGYTASAIKINSGYAEPVGPLLVYHNTFLTDTPATDAIALLSPGYSTSIRSRNNVIAGTRYALYKVNPVAWGGDGDDLYTADASRLVSWMGTRYDTLAAFRALGQEPNGLSAPPQLAAPASGNFEPGPGSPLIDAGVALPGINDDYGGAGPDVGALEWSGPPPALSFYTVTPCRVVDTRDPLLGGPSPVAAGTERVFDLAGACGLPVTAKAVSLNVTVTQPTAAGSVQVYRAGLLQPLLSTLSYTAAQTRANNAVVSLSAAGQVAVRCSQVTGSVHVIVDVNGYFE